MNANPLEHKLNKLETRLRRIVRELKSTNDIEVHAAISLFYYMQKAEEIRLIGEQLRAARDRVDHLRSLACANYTDTFHRWKKDARWLQRSRAKRW